MALIICPECGKQVSDRAATCPDCGCPIASNVEGNNAPNTPVETANVPKKSKKPLIIAVIALLLVIAAGIAVYTLVFSPEAQAKKLYAEALELYNAGSYSEALSRFETLGTYNDAEALTVCCKYELGKAAMESFDWATAVSFFTGLNYEDSERMSTDCSFMIALEQSVLRRMEINAKENSDYRNMVTTELAYLEEYRNADFYDPVIRAQAKKYIYGLDKQLSGLTYEFYYDFQVEWYAGAVARYEVLSKLYHEYHFMAENKDFVGEYVSQLEYYQKWLIALKKLDESGQINVEWNFTYNYVEIHLKNNTQYATTQIYEFHFYGDEEHTKYLGMTTVVVNDIQPYSEYTVRAYYTAAAKTSYSNYGLWVQWNTYYQEIKIN